MGKRQFATAVNCMDGRTQAPVLVYMKTKYEVDYLDMITEPGPNKILAENENQTLVDSIISRVNNSIEKQDSNLIAVIGHHNCAGNPADEKLQKIHIQEAMKNLQQWYPDIEVIGLWIERNWHVHSVGGTAVTFGDVSVVKELDKNG